jgi:acetyl-CoA synthetase
MRTGALAEAIAGVTRDSQFGLSLTFGAGGVLVDLLDDHATLILPTTRDEIERALRGLRFARLLDGYRGAERGDRNALVDALEAIAHYAEANLARLVELDVNPILVFAEGSGVCAVDALIQFGEEVLP